MRFIRDSNRMSAEPARRARHEVERQRRRRTAGANTKFVTAGESLSLRYSYLTMYFYHEASWRDGRAVEGARLESVCIERYRGFKSPSLRFFAARPCASRHHPTPSGPEGSSGQCCFAEPQIAWRRFLCANESIVTDRNWSEDLNFFSWH